MNPHKATRGDGLHLVPSQQTERIQASNELKPFTELSLVERWAEWYATVRFDRMFWLVALALTWLSVMIAWAIVSIG